MTEDLDREGIKRVLRQNGIDCDSGFVRNTTGASIRKTQGVYQNVQESSITIWLWCENHESVVKAATEIGVMNRQHKVALKRGNDVEFIQTWHEHTVGGQSVGA